MMRIAAIVAIAVGCGGSSPQPKPPVAQPPTTNTTTPPATDIKPPPAKKEVTAEAFCSRFLELKSAHCGTFDTTQITEQSCVGEVGRELTGTGKNARVMKGVGRCLLDHPSCEEVLGCLSTMSYDDPADLRACTDANDGRAVGIPRADFDRRNGAATRKFSQARSTKERPIEMCGIHAANVWLIGLSCDDGSHPLKDNSDAERSRVGNVGPGGRCGSIVDHYRVTCPEGQFDLFTDGYICPSEP